MYFTIREMTVLFVDFKKDREMYSHPMNPDRFEWSGQAICYKLQRSLINTVWCLLTKVCFFVFSITISFLNATRSGGEDSHTQIVWKIPFFLREKCQGKVFLILVITNVIHAIFYSSIFPMPLVMVPLNTW